jgi:DNA-binding transcriptional regulator YhcF (GntR family)
MARKGRQTVAEVLRDRILTGLHVGMYAGGERLPSARTIAAELGVNERVVLAALQSLAGDGFLVVRPRSGAYIVPPHPAGGSALPDIGAWLVSTLVDARARGLRPRDVPEYARRCLDTRRVRAACVECNRDQIHLLCSELADDHGFDAVGVEVEELDGSAAEAVLHDADVLVTTTFHVREVEAAAARYGKPWIAVVLRPEVMRNVARRLRDGPVYYVATDERVEPKLRQMLEPLGPVGNLRVLLVDRDDLGGIPPNAPTFVMTSARAWLAAHRGTTAGPGQPIHPPRHLSDDSARALLTFLVRSNMAAFAAGPQGWGPARAT